MNQDLFDRYTDYLISSFGPTTATGMSRMLDGQVSHDQVTRLLATAPKKSADLWREVKPLVRQIERPDGVLSIDDSIGEKPHTDENDIVCWHWSHSFDRHVKGSEFLTAFYHAGDVSLPLAFDLVEKTESYLDPKTGTEKRRSPVTKNERYRRLLRIAVHNQVSFQYVLNDVWFASADNMKYVTGDLKKQFIMPLKCNRKVAVSEADKRRGEYVAVSTLSLPEHTTRRVWLAAGPFPVLRVKQVFPNDDGSTGVRYLVTSALTLTSDHITRALPHTVGHRGLSQIAQAKRQFREVADAHRDDAAQSSVCQLVRLRQTGTTQAEDQTESLHLEDQTLPSGFADRICGACQAQRTTGDCVTSVNSRIINKIKVARGASATIHVPK